jgi:hypothetical protein
LDSVLPHVYKPKSTFETIFEGDNALKYAFSAFLIPSLGYTLFYIMAYNAGGSPLLALVGLVTFQVILLIFIR